MSLNKLVVGLMSVCALASLSSATSNSVKAKHFDPAGPGWIFNPRVDGMALIKFDQSIQGSKVHLRMEKLDGCRTYGVALQATLSGTIDYSNQQAFTTNWGGHGSFEVSLPTLDLGPSPLFFIYEWDGNTDQASIDDVTFDEIRAIGMVGQPTTPTVKIKDFDATGTGETENPCVDGIAIVSFDTLFQGSDVYLHLRDLLPNTTYGVGLQGSASVSADYSITPAFTTDWRGHGTFVTNLPGADLGTDPVVYIYIWDGDSDPEAILDITPAEMRAIGAIEEHNHHHGCHWRGCCHGNH